MSGPGVFGTDPYVAKSDVLGRIVLVMRGVTDRRGLLLTAFRSRAVPSGEIHELMTTDTAADLEDTVDRVALLGFFEVIAGGVLLVGDSVQINGRPVGEIIGFNETHMPNHQNICLLAPELRDGESIGLRVGQDVRVFRGRSA
jgi:hypothetical protein